MAIEMKVSAPNGVPLSYHRVVRVDSFKDNQTTIEVCSYIDQTGRQDEIDALAADNIMNVYMDTHYYCIPYQPNFTITDAYDYIKQLPEFAGSKNLLTVDDDPTAWASAIAGGEIKMADVPAEIKEAVRKITITEKPIDKEGFICKRKVIPTAWSVVWEFEPDPNYQPDQPDGSYLKPYPFELGMIVEESMWYTDGEDIWEAIKTGIPTGFDDTEYFDVITM